MTTQGNRRLGHFFCFLYEAIVSFSLFSKVAPKQPLMDPAEPRLVLWKVLYLCPNETRSLVLVWTNIAKVLSSSWQAENVFWHAHNIPLSQFLEILTTDVSKSDRKSTQWGRALNSFNWCLPKHPWPEPGWFYLYIPSNLIRSRRVLLSKYQILEQTQYELWSHGTSWCWADKANLGNWTQGNLWRSNIISRLIK